MGITVTGATASFNTHFPSEILHATASMAPVQDLHGYDKPWPRGGGMNMFPHAAAGTSSSNGITVVSNGAGTYTFTGTATADATISFDLVDTMIIPTSIGEGGQACFYLGNSFANSQIGFHLFYQGTLVDRWALSFANRTITTYAIMSGQSVDSIAFFIPSGTVIPSSATMTPYITNTGKSDEVFSPYENICPIEGHTEVNVWRTGINIWDEQWEIGRFDTTTGENVSTDNQIRAKNIIPVKPGSTYYVYTGNNAYVWMICLGKDGQPTGNLPTGGYGVSGKSFSVGGGDKPKTFIAPNDCYYVRFYCQISYGTTYNNNISINCPSTDTSYHAYTGTTIPVEFPALGKNLFDGTYVTAVISSASYATNTSGKSAIVKCSPNTMYTIKKHSSSNRFTIGTVASYPQNGDAVNVVYEDSSATQYTITTNSTAQYIIVYVSTSSEQAEPNLMVNTGNTAQTYEPYTSTVYGGTVDVVSGVLTVKTICYKNKWGSGRSGTVLGSNERKIFDIYNSALTPEKQQVNKLCNVAKWNWDYTLDTVHYYVSTVNGKGLCYLFLPTDADSDTDVQICADIATPLTYTLTPQQISTLRGTNVLWADTGDISVEWDLLELKGSNPIARRRHIIGNSPHLETSTGTVASFSTGLTYPLQKVEAAINPVQDLHGYANPYPPGGSKNKFGVLSSTTTNANTDGTWNGTVYTVNGLTFSCQLTPEDFYTAKVFVSGTASADTIFYIQPSTLGWPNQTDVEYTLSGCPAGGSVSTYHLTLGTDYPITGSNVDIGSGATFSVSASEAATGSFSVYIEVKSGTDMSAGYEFAPMIRLRSESAEFMSYSNICPIEGWTSVDVIQSTSNVWDGSYLDHALFRVSDGHVLTNQAYTNYGVTDPIAVTPLTNYYINFNGLNSSKYGLGWFDANNNYISGVIFSGTGIVGMVTSPANARYLRTSIYTNALSTGGIYLGTSSTSEKYGTELVTVNFPAVGRNLFSGVYETGYPMTNGDNIIYQKQNTNTKTAVISCKPNTQYTVKKFSESNRFQLTTSAISPVQGTILTSFGSFTNPATITTGADANYLLVYVSTSTEQAEPNMMVVEGTTEPTTYEPYTTTLYGGTLDLVSGILKVTHGCIALDGTESWGIGTNRFACAVSELKNTTVGRNNFRCNMFKISEQASPEVSGICSDMYSTNNLRVNPGDMTLDQFKAMLSDNNLQIVYPLVTPLTIQLTPEQLTAFKGVNNIWHNANGNTTVKYWKH